MIAALFAPLTECSRGAKASAVPVPPPTLWQKVFPRSDSQTDYNYGVARLSLSANGIATLVAFGWPLGFAPLNRRVAGKPRAWIFYLCELLLCAGTIYWLHLATLVGTPLWGAYFVFALTIAYATAALLDLALSLRRPREGPGGF
jgi:hypothetical protein